MTGIYTNCARAKHFQSPGFPLLTCLLYSKLKYVMWLWSCAGITKLSLLSSFSLSRQFGRQSSTVYEQSINAHGYQSYGTDRQVACIIINYMYPIY